MAKGNKTGGRSAGTPNKPTQDLRAKLAAMGCDPLAGMALIATGQETCTVCLGKRKLRYRRREDGELVFDPETGAVMDCLHCFGSGKEPIPISLRLKAQSELAQYIEAKRKSVEMKIQGGGDFTLEQLLGTYRNVTAGN
jgi:hypothetical protein